MSDAVIRKLYDGLDRHDGEAMASCYTADATFSDPVFPDLHDGEVKNMWRMLCARAEDLSVELESCSSDGETGKAHWIATYTFSTGREVINDIRAELRFRDGLIAEHRDSFDLWKWTRQALGPVGLVLGWSPIVQGKVRTQAADGLAEFRASQASS